MDSVTERKADSRPDQGRGASSEEIEERARELLLKRPGEEVVQLYIGAKESRVERPVKELKAFRRVQLEPGQTERVSLEVPAKELAYYDEDASTWVVEPGAYEVTVARHSEDAQALRAVFRITG